MSKASGGKTELSPGWWMLFGLLCGLGAAGLILLIAAPPRGAAIELLPADVKIVVTVNSTPTETSEPVVLASETSVFPININTATSEELQELPNIGPNIAIAIINYRDSHGPFTELEQLMNVSGIGPKTFEGIKPLITLGGS